MRTREILATIALAVLVGPALGQTKTGTTIGQFMLIEPGSRFAAMGNSGVSVSEGLQSVYYNPGAIGRLERSGLQFTHSEWIAGIDYDYAAANVNLGYWGNVFASVTSLNSGEIDITTVGQPLGTGERYTVGDLALGLGYGRKVTDRFAAGGQINYMEERIWHSTMRTVTLNLGTVYKLSDSGVQIGSSISNYGTKGRFGGRDLAIQYDNDPSRHGDNGALPGERLTDDFPVPVLFRVGASWPRQLGPQSQLIVAVDAFHPSDNEESMSVGGEWTWKNAVSLRGGYQHLAQADSETGVTLGAGFRGEVSGRGFTCDYAWTDQGRLEETHRMTFALEF